MGAMHTGLESDKTNFNRLAAFYKQRALGGVGTIITGGFSPNVTGRLTLGAAKLSNYKEAMKHQKMVQTVHECGSKILLQILVKHYCLLCIQYLVQYSIYYLHLLHCL